MELRTAEEIKVQLGKKHKKTFTSKELTGKYTAHTREYYNTENLKYKYPTDILVFNARSSECNPSHRVHPTQKPVTLFEYLIRTYTNEGETVLDNCIGSGTTAIAAINTNRNYIGIEQDAGYVEIARQRINDAMQTEVSGGDSE